LYCNRFDGHAGAHGNQCLLLADVNNWFVQITGGGYTVTYNTFMIAATTLLPKNAVAAHIQPPLFYQVQKLIQKPAQAIVFQPTLSLYKIQTLSINQNKRIERIVCRLNQTNGGATPVLMSAGVNPTGNVDCNF